MRNTFIKLIDREQTRPYPRSKLAETVWCIFLANLGGETFAVSVYPI